MSSLTGQLAADQLDIANRDEKPDGKGLKRESTAKLTVPDTDTGKGVKLAVCVMNGQDITSFELKGPKGYKTIDQDSNVTDEAQQNLSSGNNDRWIGYLIDRKDIPTPFKQTDTKLKLDKALPIPQILEWVVAYEGDPLASAHVKGHSHLAQHDGSASVAKQKAPTKKGDKKKTPSRKPKPRSRGK